MSNVDVRIALWNANGISEKKVEIEFYLNYYKIDILLLSETHCTDLTHTSIRGYTFIGVNHPSGRARGGSGILIKHNLHFEPSTNICSPKMQMTSIKLITRTNKINIAAIYCPPNIAIDRTNYHVAFNQLCAPFIAGGDFNSKHTWFGSRLSTRRGRELLSCIQSNGLDVLSTGSPTFWSSNPTVTPDLLDFFIHSGVAHNAIRISELPELFSDHLALLCTIRTSGLFEKEHTRTNYVRFQHHLDDSLISSLPLDSVQDVDRALAHMQAATLLALDKSTQKVMVQDTADLSLEIRNLLSFKRRLRRLWQSSRNANYKAQLNSATKRLRSKLSEERNKKEFARLEGLGIKATDNNSLWKVVSSTKKPTRTISSLRCPTNRTWLRSDELKANAFAHHLEEVFQPHSNCQTDVQLMREITASANQSPPPSSLERVTTAEVKEEIKRVNTRKSPGLDRINGQAIKFFTPKAVRFVTLLFNALLRLQYFPTAWKVASIVMIQKPGKPAENVSSYRPISLLPIISKIFERIILRRLSGPVSTLIPDHQFGFRKQHGTIQQCHRVANTIRTALEEKKYCPGVFLDISQAFDRVWHDGLMFKIRQRLPEFYGIINSFIRGRRFTVKHGISSSLERDARAGVPQGSVLGPILYSVFTADIPCQPGLTVATYCDDTAYLLADEDPVQATSLLQHQLHLFFEWCERWKIKVNPSKCVQVNFTLCTKPCPQLTFNAEPIPVKDSVCYLGVHLDSKLNWNTHIKKKKTQISLKVKSLHWLLRKESGMSLENKLLIYKVVIAPIWKYALELWGSASTSSIKKIQAEQAKTLRKICGAPPFVRNTTIHRDLKVDTILSTINKRSEKHWITVENHQNSLISALSGGIITRRLKRYHFEDLTTRT